MVVTRDDSLPIRSSDDIVWVRRIVRDWSRATGFTLVDETKLVTAASELARNTLIHGLGGTLRLEAVAEGGRRGLRLTFSDEGPGIEDVEVALRDGYTSGEGLGLGLGGSRRLVDEFRIKSQPGRGTEITVTRWK